MKESVYEVISKRCGRCEDNLFCWCDYEIGIWNNKNLKCADIRLLLQKDKVKNGEKK